MTFALTEFEVIQQLDGFRLSLFLAVRHEEFLGGGVCKLSPKEISEKYAKLSNYDNVCRIRKKMIAEGWFIEAVGGIITKSFNNTAKIAVEEEKELQFLQSEGEETAKIAVESENELQNLQSDTAKIAGTEIALNRNLDFKDNLEEKRENAPAQDNFQNYAFLMNLDLHEIHAYFFADKYKLELKDKQTIQNRIIDKRAWIEALVFWHENKYRAESVGKQCDKYDEILIGRVKKQDGKIKSKPNYADDRDERTISAFERKQQLRNKVESRQSGVS